MYDYNYCVYLSNFPYIDNSGMIFPCCKNRQLRLPYNIKDMKLIDMFNSPEFIQMRETMATGNMPLGCEPCYVPESKGQLDSFRVRNLRGLRFRSGDKKELLTMPYADHKIRGLDLRLGSTCNLTCIMCYPSDSNSWHKIFPDYARQVTQETENAINITMDRYQPKKLNWAEYEQSWENIFCSIDNDLRKIYLAGGEPFYIRGFEDYLVELYNRSPQAYIEINTNATRKLPEQYVKKLKGADIGIRISIDGSFGVDEYIRQGTEWDQKVEVMDQYANDLSISSFDISLSSLNIHDLPNTLRWICERYSTVLESPKTKIMLRPIVNRKGLNIESLPKYIRQNILEDLEAFLSEFTNIRSTLTNIDDVVNKLGQEYKNETQETQRIIDFWDTKSNKTYEEINPELYRWVNENSSN